MSTSSQQPNHTPAVNVPYEISHIPKLDAKQAGHLRHFHNTVSADDGEWPHMGTMDPEQAFLDAYRYQLATMTYAAAVTHYHRLPAAKSLFQTLIRRLVAKMLLPHVWNYWYLTSQSGIRLDPDIEELRKPWANPIVKENIMYSGHLLLMVSLYAMLFDDDSFERPESMVFTWAPMFWGMGPEKFAYDTQSLQRAILDEMQRLDWVGVCCEPNMVFVVCNQFPIIAMRFNDIRNGTIIADEVLKKYWPAIQRKKMIADDGLFVDALHVRQSFPRRANSVGFTAWACAHMNTWNSQWVQANFTRQAVGYITNINGQTRVQAPPVANEIRRLVKDEEVSANDEQTLQRSRKAVLNAAGQGPMFPQPLFGYVAEWLSELGKDAELKSLLDDIDTKHAPCWSDGGLYYRRVDRMVNEDGEWICMDPFSGNAGIAYGRLNLPNGLKMMWESPRPRGYFDERPYIDDLEFGQGVDCLRAYWDDENRTMFVTLKAWSPSDRVNVEFTIRNLGGGQWNVYKAGTLAQPVELNVKGAIPIQYAFAPGEEVDFVVMKAS